jgi:hypothetical protein
VSTDVVVDLSNARRATPSPPTDLHRHRRRVIAVASGLVPLVGAAIGAGSTISDESVTGLVSLDIVRRHDLHIVFPSQQYTLPLESYLMAPCWRSRARATSY